MRFGRLLLAIAFLLSSLSAANAQVTLEKLRTSPEEATSLFHPYPAAPDIDTPPPSGYKPFYISHYGRHGSRYETSKSIVETAVVRMKKLDEKGLLTEKGKELYSFLQSVFDESDGRWGELTGLGALEHREIASRMVKRFAPVFDDKGRKDVRCVASTTTRCIVSMASATGEIRSQKPALNLTYSVGDRYQSFMRSSGSSTKSISPIIDKERNQMFKEGLDPLRAGSVIFTNPEEALALIPNPISFFESVYRGWAIHLAMGFPFFDLRMYLDETSIMTLWGGTDGRYIILIGYPFANELIEDIIKRADDALDGKSVCADLRYGHDNILLRLVNQIGLYTWYGHIAEANAGGDMATAVPMGSNFQMVFYSKGRGDVLVKVLYNEKERILPGLKPVSGPYYKWTDVREAWNKLITNNTESL